MSGKLFIQTHGCQMNEYDSGKMADILAKSHGFEIVTDALQADVLLLNTCSVREKPQEKVFSQLGRWHEMKQQRPGLVIGVGGCVASQEGEAILKRAPYVDLIFGPQTIHRLPAMLDAVRATQRPNVDVSFPEIEKFDCLPQPRAEGPKAYVSIMEGCSKYCTFCVVPYTRGEEISRPFDDVIAEIVQLAEQGVREIHLLGQNVNAYRGVMHDGDVADLALLIRYISAIDGVGRIRYTTSHPLEFSDALIDVYAEVPQLVSNVHLPVQHGSDRILNLMKRGHTVLEYKAKIRRLRALRPDVSISTDFIVGFPGETETDFAAMLALVDDIKFDTSYSFIYSPRPGTPAASYPDDVSMETKKQRLATLQERLLKHAQAISVSMIGSLQQILVEGPSSRNDGRQMAGRTENNRVVNFDGDARLAGEFVTVRITEALTNSMRGELAVDDAKRSVHGAC